MKVLFCVILWISCAYSQKLSWSEYKTKFNKTYSPIDEPTRQQFFTNQKFTIDNHKDNFAKGLENFDLDYNVLTDTGFAYSYNLGFRWISWGNFPKGTPIEKPGTNESFPESFELETSKVVILDQTNRGNISYMSCNYGWAFAVAKAVEIFAINNSKQKNSAPLSPQQLIDCWNVDNCFVGIPHKALQYLADQKQPLFPENSYRYTGKKGDFCLIDLSGYVSSGTIKEFSVLEDNATQAQIKSVLVNRKSPVIFEIDPYSERFLNYKTGVYQGTTQNTHSHFMSIVGFGVEIVKEKPVEYWKVINSFGTTWGENGFMKLSRSHPIKKFVFPSKY